MRVKRTNGFTIVEIIVVISVIAVLSSLAVLTYNTIRQDTRDAARNSNATIISEALEKYYDSNGEYPSVASIVKEQPANTGSAVASKLSIPATSLVMPNTPSSTTNALTSNAEPTDDLIAYVAESAYNNSSCQSSVNGGCDKFTLTYKEEGSEELKIINSRRSSRETSGRPELELNVSSISSIDAIWSPVTGATSYELQRSLASGMTSPVTTAHTDTSSSATGLTPDTEYFFRVRAYIPTGVSDWSDIQSATTTSLVAPTGTVGITAAMSGTNARGTASGGTCQSGTTREYQIHYQVNGGSWQAWTSGSTRDVSAIEGYTYTFQARARCNMGSTNGPWKQSTTASVTRSVTAPSGLTITAAMSGTNARGTGGGGSCASGTSIQRQIRYKVNTGSMVAYTTGSPRDVAAVAGYRYTFQQQARCVGTNASSGWVASGESDIVRSVTAPSGTLTISATMDTTTTARGTAGGGSCPSGTTIERQIRYSGTSTTTESWQSYTTGTPRTVAANQGWRYNFQQQARCVGTNASSGWVASGTSSTVRPITSVPPRLASVSLSTSGSYTTWTVSANTSCPTGTTAMYVYRYITSPLGKYPPSWQPVGHPEYQPYPPHNWNVPGSTSRTMTWNTSSTTVRYNVDFQTYCKTVHHSGPWPDIGRGDHYER